MSLAAAAKTSGSTSGGDVSEERQTLTYTYTYWCHECDMSVSLFPSSESQPLLCPHCFGDFLELMDSTSSLPPDPSFPPPPPFPSVVDENYLLDSPYLHRLIHHLSARSAAAEDEDPSSAPLPASKSSVDAIPTIEISASLLDLDPFLLCAVCKDQFLLGVEAKQLPCKHLYHADCILPWLAHRNSCPVCRFQLPAERPQRDSPEGVLRLGDLMSGDEDWFDYASTLRYIARRHNLLFSSGHGSDAPASLSPSQIAEAEAETEREVGLVGRTGSLETVSSCPVEGRPGLTFNGGDGEMGVSGRGNEDGDAAMSGIKVSSSSVSENSR